MLRYLKLISLIAFFGLYVQSSVAFGQFSHIHTICTILGDAGFAYRSMYEAGYTLREAQDRTDHLMFDNHDLTPILPLLLVVQRQAFSTDADGMHPIVFGKRVQQTCLLYMTK